LSDNYVIGIDLGGTNLRVAAYADGLEFLEVIQLPTRLSEGRDQVVRDIRDAISSLQNRNFSGRTLAGVGVGAPGPLELPEGIVRNPPNLTGWDGFNLRAAIESALGRAIELDNDANVAALAEQRLGVGRKYEADSLCMLTLGTGVGSGFIVDGKIQSGSTGMGGEAGHLVVETNDGLPCGCGGFGCLEQYASATALLRMAKKIMGTRAPNSASEVAALAADGDSLAVAAFEAVGNYLAIGLTDLINSFNLPLYVLGGGLSQSWHLFEPTMFAELRRRSYLYRLTEPKNRYPDRLERHKTYIVPAELGSNSGLLGACLLATPRQTMKTAESEPQLATAGRT